VLERRGLQRTLPVELPAAAGGSPVQPVRRIVDIGALEPGETMLALERTALCSAKLEKIRIRRAPDRRLDGAGTAELTRFEPNRLALQVSASRPSLLVLGEVYYPGWKAWLDGGPVPLASGDYVLRIAPVPAGEHTVELRFRSRTFLLGLAVSLVSAAAIAVGLVRRGGGR
jgi:hypothetical protein